MNEEQFTRYLGSINALEIGEVHCGSFEEVRIRMDRSCIYHGLPLVTNIVKEALDRAQEVSRG